MKITYYKLSGKRVDFRNLIFKTFAIPIVERLERTYPISG